MRKPLLLLLSGVILGMLTSCAVRQAPRPVPPIAAPAQPAPEVGRPPQDQALTASEWVPVPWSDLPGWREAALEPVWGVLLRNCERPTAAVAAACPDIRRLSIAEASERRAWMENYWQPHRLQSHAGQAQGLLTAYYEPEFDAMRSRRPGFEVPLYAPPQAVLSGPARNQPWHSREAIDTRPDVQAQLQPLAWLADPVDALVLHIQGSGRLRITEDDGRVREVAIRFAATNNWPYRSVGRALLDARELTDASWPGIRQWLNRNPQRRQSVFWTNPRYVFFKESPIVDPEVGPPGAQGVPLSAMRSIAVDPKSVPYGSLVWLVTQGPQLNLQQLVLAQDTGSAIVGAVRADLFAGTGPQAGELAGRVKQPLWLWAFKPRP